MRFKKPIESCKKSIPLSVFNRLILLTGTSLRLALTTNLTPQNKKTAPTSAGAVSCYSEIAVPLLSKKWYSKYV